MSATDWLEKRNDPDPEWKWSNTTQPAEIFFKKFHTSNTDLILGICVQCWSAKKKKTDWSLLCWQDQRWPRKRPERKEAKEEGTGRSSTRQGQAVCSCTRPRSSLHMNTDWVVLYSDGLHRLLHSICDFRFSVKVNVICWVLSEWPIGVNPNYG